VNLILIYNELIRSEFQRLFNVYLFGRKCLNSLRDKRRKRLFRSEGTLPRLGTGWRSIDPLDVEFRKKGLVENKIVFPVFLFFSTSLAVGAQVAGLAVAKVCRACLLAGCAVLTRTVSAFVVDLAVVA